jgi:hypothetical protein
MSDLNKYTKCECKECDCPLKIADETRKICGSCNIGHHTGGKK